MGALRLVAGFRRWPAAGRAFAGVRLLALAFTGAFLPEDCGFAPALLALVELAAVVAAVVPREGAGMVAGVPPKCTCLAGAFLAPGPAVRGWTGVVSAAAWAESRALDRVPAFGGTDTGVFFGGERPRLEKAV